MVTYQLLVIIERTNDHSNVLCREIKMVVPSRTMGGMREEQEREGD